MIWKFDLKLILIRFWFSIIYIHFPIIFFVQLFIHKFTTDFCAVTIRSLKPIRACEYEHYSRSCVSEMIMRNQSGLLNAIVVLHIFCVQCLCLCCLFFFFAWTYNDWIDFCRKSFLSPINIRTYKCFIYFRFTCNGFSSFIHLEWWMYKTKIERRTINRSQSSIHNV